MAEYWNGSASGDYDAAGNWVTASPTSGDVIYPASTTQGVTSGCDNENAHDYDTMWIQEGANYDLGSAGTPMYMSADLLKFEGGGKLFFKGGDVVTDLVVIKARPATANITSVTLTDGGTHGFTAICVQQGNVSIGASLTDTITTLTVMGQSIVTLGASNVVTTYTQTGGTVTASTAPAESRIYGGVFNLDTAVLGAGGIDIYGGIVNILTTGTHPLINLWGGYLDLTRSGNLKTVSVLNVYGGEYKTNKLVTLTALNDYR